MRGHVPTFTGRLLLEDDVLEGTLTVEGGRVVEWLEGETDRHPTATGWILPSPVNAHTHVADTFARDRPGKPATVAELVGPGGWKSKQLATASAAEVEAGIHRYVGEMATIGTARFVDFREGGLDGVRLLRRIADDLPVQPLIMGRPSRNGFDPDEAAALLSTADGVGLSARRDFADHGDVESWAEACHAARKPFALHASEAAEEDLEAIAALEPAFLVHCTRASRDALSAVADAGIPVVVCPRSNAHYGLKTPLDRMRGAGVTVAVGTDNGMLNDGDLLAELGQLKAWFPAVPTADLLRTLSFGGRQAAGMPRPAVPRPGDPADLVVLPFEPFRADSSHKPGFVVPPASTAAPHPPARA